jgi:hypothetical protein
VTVAETAVFPIWTIPDSSVGEGGEGEGGVVHPQSSAETPNTHSMVDAGVRREAILEVQNPSCVASHISLTEDYEFCVKNRTTMVFDKSQWVRLLDVLFLGPFMVWYALQSRGEMSNIAVCILFFSGVLTIVYNGINYMGNYGWISRTSLFGTK